MSTQEKVAKVNELAAGGMKKMDALKKVGIPYGTYYSAGKGKTKPGPKPKTKQRATRIKQAFTMPIPEHSAGVITMNVRDFTAFVRELVKHG